MFEPAYIKILNWNTAKDKMWNGIGWYGLIGPTTSTTDISLHHEMLGREINWASGIFHNFIESDGP